MRPGQDVENAGSPLRCRAHKRGDCVGIAIRARAQAHQPERAGGLDVEVLVGPGEHSPHHGAGVTHPYPVGPAFAADRPTRQPNLSTECWGVQQLARPRPVVPAAAGSTVRPALQRRWDRRRPVADQCTEEADRLFKRQQVQVHPDGTIQSHQPGQRITTGHYRHAGWEWVAAAGRAPLTGRYRSRPASAARTANCGTGRRVHPPPLGCPGRGTPSARRNPASASAALTGWPGS